MSLLLAYIKHFKKVYQIILVALLLMGFACSKIVKAQVGVPLEPWTEGYLDIHHINTGLGDIAFIIMPDGTTMIIDAGDTSLIERPPLFKAPQRPDTTRSAGESMGRYILARHPDTTDPKIDYALVTHFHSDHISALPDLIKQIPVKNLFDRDWPHYQTIPDHPQELPKEYFEIPEMAAELGIQMHRFEAGRKDQFVLRNHPEQYPEFHIRNLAVN